ncbi:MFS transporter [Halomonas sp. MCCC 1A17488]|uniref:MFS transporter n=1 Tax=Billgrantia sulfidoxydans TaxID=2733484 RepID=A0ABX7VYP7_9GAMM|nr:MULTISPECIES: MFS transporter [Halomonas]MCE8016990.1 MFS transporter [Halomonas sp. MCCC 1A17488]MCG3240323.1 MFS transporter [Halomonas sp. MCCC 1A17488]QPP49808.1 MFS transporter [Halomonas sp. SS10-MC5]QTP53416.1 MFS transporter [Halomonas sulfidoxydans]
MTSAEKAPVVGQQVDYRSLVVVLLSPLAFALVFASWTIFAVLGIELKLALGFGEVQFAVLLAMPMFTGALSALPLAALARLVGGRRVMIGCLLLICPFLWAIAHSNDYWEFLLAGAGLGVGAGSLAAGLVYVAALCPRRHAGLALGLYGAGMLGAGLTYFLLPLISQAYGWPMAPKLYLLPIALVALLLWVFAEESPRQPAAPGGNVAAALPGGLPPPAACRLALYYSFFYGAFVALALWLPAYLMAQYRLTLMEAALWALVFTLPGGLGQILGGALADRRDFRDLRWWVSACVMACLFLLSYPDFSMQIHGVHGDLALEFSMPLAGFAVLLAVMGLAMGIGKGSLMCLIHRDHGDDMVRSGGLALALGGLFAAALPLMFVLGNEWIGVRTAGFMFLYAALAVCMLVMLWEVGSRPRARRLREGD